MEYAISVGVTLIFLAIFILTRGEVRPKYPRELDDEQFYGGFEKLTKTMPLPTKTSKTDGQRYLTSINKNLRKIKRKKYGERFSYFIIDKKHIKETFARLNMGALPSVDGEARAVKIARYCIDNSGGKLDMDRFGRALEAQNRVRTLTFKEIDNMAQAIKFVLLENLASLYVKLVALAKCEGVAVAYIKSPLSVSGKYKDMLRSPLFLSMCADIAGYKSEKLYGIYDGTMAGLKTELDRIKSALKILDREDFTPYYTPLEIFDKYETFASAGADTKKNFLSLVGELSDRENLDEFLIAIRVDKYMSSASAGHMNVKRLNFAGRKICLINQKKDISMLGAALSSHYFMELFFRPTNNRINSRSITKILDFENTFEPIYKFRTVNFGISAKDGRLTLSPRLPKEVEGADVAFRYGGVRHILRLRRGGERQLYLGNTLLKGTSEIKLSSRPLEITLIIGDEEEK